MNYDKQKAIETLREWQGWQFEGFGGVIDYAYRAEYVVYLTNEYGWELERHDDGERYDIVSGETVAELELALTMLDHFAPPAAQRKPVGRADQPCTCRQVDADLVDAFWCRAHGI